MKAKIVKIGNSKGIRIPMPFLLQSGIEEEVELIVGEGQLIILPVENSRKGWKEAFSNQVVGERDLQLDEVSNLWDEEGWRW